MNDGGPAFPIGPNNPWAEGITKLDLFALAVLSGLAAHQGANIAISSVPPGVIAYEVAKGALAERDRLEKGP